MSARRSGRARAEMREQAHQKPRANLDCFIDTYGSRAAVLFARDQYLPLSIAERIVATRRAERADVRREETTP